VTTHSPIIISVGSGKGGVGKSSFISNLGTTLAGRGNTVGFVDADLEAANLHLCLGVRRPKTNLHDFMTGRLHSLAETSVETVVPGTWLISGASDILQLANPRYTQKQKLINHLKSLSADYLLIDLGAGTDNNVIDFFTAFQCGVVVSDAMPASVETAYGFLKNGIIRGAARLFPGRKDIDAVLYRFADARASDGFASFDDVLAALAAILPEEARHIREWLVSRRIFLVLNMVRQKEDLAVAQRFVDMVKKYLSIKLYYIGYIPYDPIVPQSSRRLRPAVLDSAATTVRDCFSLITDNLCAIIGK
jgi:flagellar biosynthesis protein FlhG